jgi:hypothetical protein
MPNNDIHSLCVHVHIREMSEGAVVEPGESISQFTCLSVFVADYVEGQEHLVGFGVVSGQRAWEVLTNQAMSIYVNI